jgi:hypothetical protein
LEREVREWHQYDAARPTLDPNDAARDYPKGQGGNQCTVTVIRSP